VHAGRVRADVVPARESQGACWAKARAHALRRDERYVLQIDSHMRFHPGWDEQMLATLARCPSPRPVLTTYPAIYETTGTLECNTPHLTANKFDDNRILTFLAHNHSLKAPKPGAFIAGGFIFAPAALFDEVPYDPAVYFVGEEVSFSARAWTHGWDPFSPNLCLVHHLYERKGMPRHWSDNKDWTARNNRSFKRVRALIGVEACDDPDVVEGLDGRMGLGRVRTLEEYSAYCGVDFKARTISEHGKLGAFPPAPRPASRDADVTPG
jgi:hypothetical protein